LGVNRHLASGHEISRLQHGLQLIMARYTRIIKCRPCCNLYILGWRRGVVVSVVRRTNEVNLRRARLVLGWVTVSGRVYHHGT